jgi:6,7-dimethyl-8-ribityllumazine synthase
MASSLKNLSDVGTVELKRAGEYKIGIVVSAYHNDITFALRDGAVATLKENGIAESNITVKHVPGAFELPLAAKWLKDEKNLDAVICLGCVIKGETDHDIYINTTVAKALMDLCLQDKVPYVFGVITPNTAQQAKERAGGKHGNKGVECASAALHMLSFKERI